MVSFQMLNEYKGERITGNSKGGICSAINQYYARKIVENCVQNTKQQELTVEY